MTLYSRRSKEFFVLFALSLLICVPMAILKGNCALLGISTVCVLASGLGLAMSRLHDESLDRICKLSHPC